MIDPDVLAYYERGEEHRRLQSGFRRIEFVRTWDLLVRHLMPAPATIVDIGGAAGIYALPLAAAGYDVHLIDPVPLHVEQARAASFNASKALASIAIGDARALTIPDGFADAALLLGPLYHLTEAADRMKALSEARRVVRVGGLVFAVALSRFYPTWEFLARDKLGEDGVEASVAETLRTGEYRNRSHDPAAFTTAYFHRPEELADEIRAAGLQLRTLAAVEGYSKLLPDLSERLDDPTRRGLLMRALQRIETEPSALGATQHVLAVAEVR